MVPQLIYTALGEYEQHARDLSRGLCQDIPDNVRDVFEDHHNPRDDWRDDKDLEMRTAQLRDSVGCTTTLAVVDAALEQIRAQTILIKPLWSIRTRIMENGVRVNMLMPIIRHLGQLYNALHFHSIRELIIALVSSGVDINTATPNVHDAVPVVFSLLGGFHLDYFLHRAILRARPRVDPVWANREHAEGITMPLFFAERTIAVITKHVLQTGDQMRYANSTFEDAVKALANHPDGLGSEWRGDLYLTEFVSLYNVSALYRDLVGRFNRFGPEKRVPIEFATGVADELFRQLLQDLLNFTNWKLSEVCIRIPVVYFNILHIMVLNTYPKSLNFFFCSLPGENSNRPGRANVYRNGASTPSSNTARSYWPESSPPSCTIVRT